MHNYVFTLQCKKTLNNIQREITASNALEALSKIKLFAKESNSTIVHMEQPSHPKVN